MTTASGLLTTEDLLDEVLAPGAGARNYLPVDGGSSAAYVTPL